MPADDVDAQEDGAAQLPLAEEFLLQGLSLRRAARWSDEGVGLREECQFCRRSAARCSREDGGARAPRVVVVGVRSIAAWCW